MSVQDQFPTIDETVKSATFNEPSGWRNFFVVFQSKFGINTNVFAEIKFSSLEDADELGLPIVMAEDRGYAFSSYYNRGQTDFVGGWPARFVLASTATINGLSSIVVVFNVRDFGNEGFVHFSTNVIDPVRTLQVYHDNKALLKTGGEVIASKNTWNTFSLKI